MPIRPTAAKGFSIVFVLVIILLIGVLGLGGWAIWKAAHKNDDAKTVQPSSVRSEKSKGPQSEDVTKMDEALNWKSVTSQGKKFTMKVPDGWVVTSYPGDFLGGTEVAYKPGTPAVINSTTQEYVGHSLRFRASIHSLDDSGFGPQWESPQPGLKESKEEFVIGNLKGTRFKGDFSTSLGQTLYQYVFDLGQGSKLDVVYTVYHDVGEQDIVETVEKAVRTIKILEPSQERSP